MPAFWAGRRPQSLPPLAFCDIMSIINIFNIKKTGLACFLADYVLKKEAVILYITGDAGGRA